MAFYEIELSNSAQKDLRKLDEQLLRRVTRTIDSLSSTPRPRGSRKLEKSTADYRVRVGSYRVIYEVDDPQRRVIVHYVRHRREAYR